MAKALEFSSGLMSFDSLEVMLPGKSKSTSLTSTVDRPSSGGGGASGSTIPLMLMPTDVSITSYISYCSKSSTDSVYHSIGPDLFRTQISFSSHGVLIPGLNKTINCSINSGQLDIMKNKQIIIIIMNVL